MGESGRSSMDYLCDINSNITVTKWLDNGVVQLLSTYVPVVYGEDVRRWSKTEKRIIDVKCPIVVHEYNKYMGGVDLCDMLLSLYRIRIGTKKWCLVYYCLGIAIVNAWLVYASCLLLLGDCHSKCVAGICILFTTAWGLP